MVLKSIPIFFCVSVLHVGLCILALWLSLSCALYLFPSHLFQVFLYRCINSSLMHKRLKICIVLWKIGVLNVPMYFHLFVGIDNGRTWLLCISLILFWWFPFITFVWLFSVGIIIAFLIRVTLCCYGTEKQQLCAFYTYLPMAIQ